MGQCCIQILGKISRLKLSQFESFRTRQDIELPNTVVFIFVSIEVSCPGLETDGLLLKSDSCTFIPNYTQIGLKFLKMLNKKKRTMEISDKKSLELPAFKTCK